MPAAETPRQTDIQHLSLFLTREGGKPLTHIPVFAELGLVAPTPERPLDQSFDEIVFSVLSDLKGESPVTGELRQRLRDVLWRAIVATVDEATLGELVKADAEMRKLVADALKRLRKQAGGAGFAGLGITRADRRVDAAVRAAAERLGLALQAPQDSTLTWSYPLGVLASDHVGYLSYDLARLPPPVRDQLAEAVRGRLSGETDLGVAMLVYPFGLPQFRFNAFDQGRIRPDAIVARHEIDLPGDELPAAADGAPAMQRPSVTDWRLSPASFASNPTALLGDDAGCEQLFPAQLAVQEYSFYQIVGLSDVALPNLPANLSAAVRPGFLQEYRTSWYPLGHSLGRILYTLPLAPGESVNLAVIDWRRQDHTQREEQTTVAEQLTHQQTRDRTITETVTAAIDEWQRGGNIMGGAAGSFGAGPWSVSATLGGGYSTSSGSRDIAATTVQKLSDNIAQASSSFRELNSTVVLETTQTEHEAIETRTIVNYNHSHTMTILYYEVLRHFRVTTELVRRRPVVLVKARTDWVTDPKTLDQNVREHRAILQAALLDPRHGAGLDAFENRARRRLRADVAAASAPKTPTPPPPPPADSGARPLHHFTFEMKTGGFVKAVDAHDQHIDVLATLHLDDGTAVELVNIEGNKVLANFGAFSLAGMVNTFTAIPEGGGLVRWDKITGLALSIMVFAHADDETTKVSFSHVKLTGLDVSGQPGVTLVDQNYDDGNLVITNHNEENGRKLMLPTLRPAPAPLPGPSLSAEELEDEARATELLAHLQYHAAVYNRAIALGRNVSDRADELDGMKLAGNSTVLEHVENRPLEMIGDHVAYPSTDESWNARILDSLPPSASPDAPPDERLITFPTRGVFGEGTLGHCNISEEINKTRFWDWQKSPIPHMAPEIAPIQGVTPTVQTPALQPTAFPSSLVNIVNPPAAPDPQGMQSVLSALATPGIFRDMSGRAEVAGLLDDLAKGTMSNVAAQTKAKEIQGKFGSDLLKPSGGTGTGGTSAGSGGGGSTQAAGAALAPTAEDANDRRKVIQAMQDAGQITSEQAQEGYQSLGQQLAQAASPVAPRPPTPKAPKPQGPDILPTKGLTFIIQVNTVANTAPTGTLDATVYGISKTESFQHKALQGGGVTLQTKDIATGGRIGIGVEYQVNSPGDIIADTIDNAGTRRPPKQLIQQLYNAEIYSLPANSTIIELSVRPHTETIQKKATTAQGAADKVAGELGASLLEIVSVKLSGEAGTSTQTGQETSWNVFVVTGGLDIVQRNTPNPAPKP